MSIPTLVEVETRRAEIMTRKDHRQRWVTMDGHIHTEPVPYRDAVSICWMPLVGCCSVNYRSRAIAHPA